MHDFDADNVKRYNPADYGLPVWRDEEHAPPEAVEVKAEAKGADSMTVDVAKNKLCAWAMSQVGYHEGAGNWNQYAENADLQQMYGWKPQNQPWCDVFYDVGMIECFGLAAKVSYHGLCQTLWNAPDVITAHVMIADEQLDVVEGYKEYIHHEPAAEA